MVRGEDATHSIKHTQTFNTFWLKQSLIMFLITYDLSPAILKSYNICDCLKGINFRIATGETCGWKWQIVQQPWKGWTIRNSTLPGLRWITYYVFPVFNRAIQIKALQAFVSFLYDIAECNIIHALYLNTLWLKSMLIMLSITQGLSLGL